MNQCSLIFSIGNELSSIQSMESAIHLNAPVFEIAVIEQRVLGFVLCEKNPKSIFLTSYVKKLVFFDNSRLNRQILGHSLEVQPLPPGNGGIIPT